MDIRRPIYHREGTEEIVEPNVPMSSTPGNSGLFLSDQGIETLCLGEIHMTSALSNREITSYSFGAR